MNEIGNADRQEVGGRLNNRAENSHQPFRRRERAMRRFRSMKTLQKFSSVVVVGTRSDGRRPDRVRLLVVVRRRSISPLPGVWRQGTFASASCRSTSAPGAAFLRCSFGPCDRGRSGVRRSIHRSSFGRRRGRTRRAPSCGSARRCHWSAGSWSWCACGRRPRPPDRARIRDARDCRNITCRDRSERGRASPDGRRRTARPDR
jgi:hypothetical protein